VGTVFIGLVILLDGRKIFLNLGDFLRRKKKKANMRPRSEAIAPNEMPMIAPVDNLRKIVRQLLAAFRICLPVVTVLSNMRYWFN
jgi:hypothetical protein